MWWFIRIRHMEDGVSTDAGRLVLEAQSDDEAFDKALAIATEWEAEVPGKVYDYLYGRASGPYGTALEAYGADLYAVSSPTIVKS